MEDYDSVILALGWLCVGDIRFCGFYSIWVQGFVPGGGYIVPFGFSFLWLEYFSFPRIYGLEG